MSTMEIRRHSMRTKPGQHLSPAGSALAREVGEHSGPFDLVITSTIARAHETAEAMGFSVDHRYGTLDQAGAGEMLLSRWPFDFAQASTAIGRGGDAARFGRRLYDLLRMIARRLPSDGAALVITHGGFIEIAAVACLPEADHASWGAACDYMEGVRLTWDDGAFVSAEILRVARNDLRIGEG